MNSYMRDSVNSLFCFCNIEGSKEFKIQSNFYIMNLNLNLQYIEITLKKKYDYNKNYNLHPSGLSYIIHLYLQIFQKRVVS